MGLIDDLKALALAKLPDNNQELINPVDQRAVVDAVVDAFASLIPQYIRVDLNNAATYTNDALKVASNRLMIISAGTVISSGPVNDGGDPDPENWDYPGGGTPTSWSHDQATGKIWLPTEKKIVEIYIRPVL